MPTASVHYVFASHDAMVEQLVESILTAQSTGVAEAVVEAPTLRDFVDGRAPGLARSRGRRPRRRRSRCTTSSRWSRSSPELHHLAAAVYAQYSASVSSFVEAAGPRFGVRWRVPVDDVARFVLVLTDGVAARWLVDRDDDAARRALALGAEALLGLVQEEGA